LPIRNHSLTLILRLPATPSMDFPYLIQQYGLAAVFVGTFFEGETVLLIASASTHLGMLDLRAVIAVATVGAFLGDNVFFMIGHHLGPRVADRLPWVAKAVPRVDLLIARWRWIAVIALRFMYGLRMAGPVIIGAGTMPAWEFMAANALGAVLWAFVIAGLGYAAGHAVERMLGSVVEAEKALLAVAVVIIVAVIIVHTVMGRRAKRAKN
jgi:membrane protein DedA with SNARE-associated domain